MKRPLPHRPLDERVLPMLRLISSLKDCTLVLTLSSDEKQTNKYRCSRVKQYTSKEKTRIERWLLQKGYAYFPFVIPSHLNLTPATINGNF